MLFSMENIPEKFDKEKFETEILSQLERDQEMRNRWMELGVKEYDPEIDKGSQKMVKEYVSTIGGWPTISEFGEEVTVAFWHLMQHSIDADFQKDMVEEMQKLPASEVRAKDLARTIDRIRMKEGKGQLYGTHFRIKDGQLLENPIDDFDQVDKRRKEIGLEETYEEFKKRAFEEYENEQEA